MRVCGCAMRVTRAYMRESAGVDLRGARSRTLDVNFWFPIACASERAREFSVFGHLGAILAAYRILARILLVAKEKGRNFAPKLTCVVCAAYSCRW